jgi:hypothetical protein
MGLSRRRFTKGFKLAGVQRLEMGASLAEGSAAHLSTRKLGLYLFGSAEVLQYRRHA